MPKTPDQFIGREAELQWLKVAWEQARQGQPQICILRGESGYGKTRVAQAFYSWLSSDPEHDPQGYWPDVLLKEGSNLRLNPSSGFGGGKTLPWLWWGVRWTDPDLHNRGELSSCALIDGLQHLDPHREALLARSLYLQRAAKAATAVGSSLAGLLSFGIFDSLKSAYELHALHKEERDAQEKEKLSVEERQAAALQSQIDNLYEFLSGVLKPSSTHASGLPLILVLDDAQWIDARSLTLIDRLLVGARRHGWPLMIIVTHWERDWNLLEREAQRMPWLCRRLADEPSEGQTLLSISIRDIDRLDGLERLLRDALPGLTAEQVAFLCGRADGNPRLMTEIILELQDEPLYFEQEDIGKPLSAEGLADLKVKNFALHEVQKRRFRKLDAGLRKLLGYASYQGMRFLRQLVLDVAHLLDQERATEAHAGQLAHAVEPYAVLAAESAGIYEFRHRVFHDLARELIGAQLGRTLGKALLKVADDWLQRDQLAALAPAEREAFYLLMLEQPDLADTASPELRLRLMAGLLGLYLSTGYLAKARSWADTLTGELPADGRIAIEVLSCADQRDIVYAWLELDRRHPAETLARGLVETCRAELATSGSSADRLRDVAAAEVWLGDVLRTIDRRDEALELYQTALETSQRILRDFGETAERLRDLSVSQVSVGDVLIAIDRRDEALKLYQASLETCERILCNFGETAESLRHVSVSQGRVGDVLLATDQRDEALKLYQASLETCEHILRVFGDTARRLWDVSVSQIRVGDALFGIDQRDALRFYQESLEIRERILRDFGETSERLRDVSVSQERVGEVLFAIDRRDEALRLRQALLDTRERIVRDFGENAERLRDVSVGQDRVGDSMLNADQPEAARELYERSLATFERIIREFGETAQRLSDLSWSQIKLGDVLRALDQSKAAQAQYEASLATCERVVREFGETAERLCALSASHERVGDSLLSADHPKEAWALYEKSLAIDEHLIREFGETAQRLRGLSLSQKKIGDVLRSLDQPKEAWALYEKSLAIDERLIREFGETAERLLDLSVSQERVGDSLLNAAEPKAARELYEKSLDTRERLICEFGETAERLSALAWAQRKAGGALQALDHPKAAQAQYEASLAICERVIREFGETARRLSDLSISQDRVGDSLLNSDQPERARLLYEELLATCERLISGFGETAERLSDLAVSHIRLGSLAAQAGGPVLARERFVTAESLLTSAIARFATPRAQALLDHVRALIADIDRQNEP